MKIAFTTSDRTHINAHFGWAKTIDVYDVSTSGYQFLETLHFDGELKEDGNEDKLYLKSKPFTIVRLSMSQLLAVALLHV